MKCFLFYRTFNCCFHISIKNKYGWHSSHFVPYGDKVAFLFIKLFMERMMFMLNLWFKSNYCYQEELNIMPNDIEITIFETPSHNWGIRGLPGNELSLDYNIKI
ncbi:hypothetical protein CKR_3236 [Clostridium kluyveri NBRC 12016]|nr:hypothetical protein CKR_3236 [Clostridium kluyveri NBRC 12016]